MGWNSNLPLLIDLPPPPSLSALWSIPRTPCGEAQRRRTPHNCPLATLWPVGWLRRWAESISQNQVCNRKQSVGHLYLVHQSRRLPKSLRLGPFSPAQSNQQGSGALQISHCTMQPMNEQTEWRDSRSNRFNLKTFFFILLSFALFVRWCRSVWVVCMQFVAFSCLSLGGCEDRCFAKVCNTIVSRLIITSGNVYIN